ncbi:DUF4767 domain-containing protein [Pediococcus acidilactici]|uniref:DUF4767 domain-containing protein n=1 Tax=Pediococcus acidilactici TaxID=1254 RepID=UPI003A93CF94
MKHMKKGSRWPVNPVVWVIVALLVILGGYKFFYPSHVEPEHTTARQSSSTKVIDVEEGSSSAKKATTKKHKHKSSKDKLWTKKQDAKLAAFISDWQQTMGQSYTGTNSGSSVTFQGVTLPDYLSTGTVYVNQQPVTMKWTTNKKDGSDYQVVAAYAGTQYLYLFTFHQQTPEVLVTSQAASDGVNFKVTENAQLVNGFQNIVNGQNGTADATQLDPS